MKKGLLSYLKNIKQTKSEISYLSEWRKEILETRISIKGIDYSKESFSKTGTINDLSDSIVKLEKIEIKLTEEINKYTQNFLKALRITRKLNDLDSKVYITKKFISGKSYRKIAKEENKTPSAIYKKINKSINAGV